jgi:hypothetical protein
MDIYMWQLMARGYLKLYQVNNLYSWHVAPLTIGITYPYFHLVIHFGEKHISF